MTKLKDLAMQINNVLYECDVEATTEAVANEISKESTLRFRDMQVFRKLAKEHRKLLGVLDPESTQEVFWKDEMEREINPICLNSYLNIIEEDSKENTTIMFIIGAIKNRLGLECPTRDLNKIDDIRSKNLSNAVEYRKEFERVGELKNEVELQTDELSQSPIQPIKAVKQNELDYAGYKALQERLRAAGKII